MKKRKTKPNNLDTSERTETRTKRRLTEDKPLVLVETPPPIVQVEETEETHPSSFVGWIICNNIIESVWPSKGLWFPATVTQLSIQSGMEVEKNEVKIKARLAITTRASTKGSQMGGHKLGSGILEDMKEIREMQQRIINFVE